MQTMNEVKARIGADMANIAEGFKAKPFDPEHVAQVMAQLLTRVASEAYASPEDYNIKVLARHDDDGGPTVIVQPGNLQTFILMQGWELPPTAAQLATATGWMGENGNYFVEDGKYYYSPKEPSERITFTAQLDPAILAAILKPPTEPTEDKTATVGVICNTSANFVHLKNAFAAREDLAGYKLLMISDDKRAKQYANIIDFAILYTPAGENGLNDRACRAYKILDQYEVTIRVQFLKVVNYTEK